MSKTVAREITLGHEPQNHVPVDAVRAFRHSGEGYLGSIKKSSNFLPAKCVLYEDGTFRIYLSRT
ncbi:MAG: hypothetical protein LBM41_06180 [Ruminococcus sp.]|nr:hypothetical protein [Ruminococcus sp.]